MVYTLVKKNKSVLSIMPFFIFLLLSIHIKSQGPKMPIADSSILFRLYIFTFNCKGHS